MCVPMATTNLFYRSGLPRRRVHLARSRAFAPTRCRRRCRRWIWALKSARRPTCSGAGAKARKSTPPRIRSRRIKRFREALNFLCEYSRDQQLQLPVRARSQAERAARRFVFPDDGRVSRVHPDAAVSRDGRRQPGGRARAHGRAELLPRHRAGARGGQALSHRSQRSEVRPLRPGSAVRVRIDQGQLLRRQAARGLRLRRPAPLRRARLPHRGSGRRLGFRRAAACGPT